MKARLLAALISLFIALPVMAKGFHDDEGGSSPRDADLVFVIDSNHIMYREDGYMLVCLNATERVTVPCGKENKVTPTIDEFWHIFFAKAKLKTVGIGYHAYMGKFVFYLRRVQ